MRRTLPLLLLVSCATEDYVAEADRDVYGILERVSMEVSGEAKTFPLERPVDTLRTRLLESNEPVVLDLQGALDVAAENSREFQFRKESLYLAALDLTRQQHEFAVRFGGGGRADIDGVGDDSADVALSDDLSAAVNTVSGGRIVFSFVNTFLRSVVNGGGFDGSSILGLTITQPLLRGLGSHVVREPLTQSERNVVYEVRSFEQFRKQLAVTITSDYYQLVRQVADLESEQANYRSVTDSRQQIEELFRAGRRDINDVDQAAQNELNAESRLNSARNRLDSTLDNFKLRLGLPVTAELILDLTELDKLAALGVTDIDLMEERATKLALERRYDYRTACDRVADAARRIVVAEDALRSSLDFSAAFSVPTDPNQPLDFDWSRVSWSAGFNLDLALDRLPERNAYRSSLITLDVRIRDRDELEDSIRADIRRSLRDIESTIEGYSIQVRAVELAERRVESTTELYDADRAQARDILDAQDALLSARLNLSGALVDYSVARLELMRDLEALAIEPKGLRYDRTLPIPELTPVTAGD